MRFQYFLGKSIQGWFSRRKAVETDGHLTCNVRSLLKGERFYPGALFIAGDVADYFDRDQAWLSDIRTWRNGIILVRMTTLHEPGNPSVDR